MFRRNHVGNDSKVDGRRDDLNTFYTILTNLGPAAQVAYMRPI